MHSLHVADVENEIIATFATFSGYPVVVYNVWEEHVHVTLPTQHQHPWHGYEMLKHHRNSRNESVRTTPFVLWSNGGHYQAVVSRNELEITATAAASFAYANSNLLYKKDATRKQQEN